MGAKEYLVVQLKRFGNDLKKITDPVPFHESGVIDFSQAFDDLQTHLYKLVSTVRHSGSVEGGHYVAHVHYQGRWIEFNDEVVSLNAQVGNEATAQNYLLLFESYTQVTSKLGFSALPNTRD